ncbi:hypothetical protein Pve01_50090 [Planomonospora venezuelensis]|nr:hypothetical protein Pve01_50090 [Planomonospora venezuelensis]
MFVCSWRSPQPPTPKAERVRTEGRGRREWGRGSLVSRWAGAEGRSAGPSIALTPYGDRPPSGDREGVTTSLLIISPERWAYHGIESGKLSRNGGVLAMAAELSFLVFWLFGMLVLFFIIYSAVRLALKHDRRSRGR